MSFYSPDPSCCFFSNLVSTTIGTLIALVISSIIIYYIIAELMKNNDYIKSILSSNILNSFSGGLDQLNTKIPLTKLTQDDLKSLICKVPFAKC